MTSTLTAVNNEWASTRDHSSEYSSPILSVLESGLQPYCSSTNNISLQGKVAELRTELASASKKDKNHSQKKITMKKIVANMTMSNNDMVALFPEIVETMKIESLELKKM